MNWTIIVHRTKTPLIEKYYIKDKLLFDLLREISEDKHFDTIGIEEITLGREEDEK